MPSGHQVIDSTIVFLSIVFLQTPSYRAESMRIHSVKLGISLFTSVQTLIPLVNLVKSKFPFGDLFLLSI